jgi:L-cysteine desulfidase
VLLKTSEDTATAIIENGHTNLVYLEKNNTQIFQKDGETEPSHDKDYKRYLKGMRISDLADLAENMDAEDCDYVRQGVKMNLRLSEAGRSLKKVSYYLSNLRKKGYLAEGVFSSTEILTASATDARMAGMDFPAMASGGSGNQGIVATLVPYNVGKFFEIEEKKIVRSIALSHLMNSYIKCFTGDLSPLCGCAIAAGVGAAVAIVYQQKGKDMEKITLAVNNLISDIGGMLCDGAKGGCALKVVSSSDSAIRSAYMALNDHGITEKEGFVGKTAEETIYNLSRVSEIGMQKADDTMLGIMMAKNR